MDTHLQGVKIHPDTFPVTDAYPFSLPVFQATRSISFDSPVTFFVGENGTGKSTLLEAIAIAGGIHIWSRDDGVRLHENRHEKQLCKTLSLKWHDGRVPGSYFGSEIFSDFRRIVEGWAASDPRHLDYFGGKSLVAQSHGQSMMSFFRSRYTIKGIYFLDEPETALSPRSQIELLEIIRENTKDGHAQFLIATHSPLLLSYTGAQIYTFDNASIEKIDYHDTDHYRLYKRFLLKQS